MKIPTCKNCGKTGHYTYQCWVKKKRPVKRTRTSSKAVKSPKMDKLPSKTRNERRRLINSCDRLLSIYVRRHGADSMGYNICYTCGMRFPWKALDCGHYIKRGYFQTRWDLRNVRPQCQYCNRTLGGNYLVYTKRITKELGEDEVLKMWDKAYSRVKVSTAELMVLEEKLKKMVVEVH